jgi:hypothetical protein
MFHQAPRYFVWLMSSALLLGMAATPVLAVQDTGADKSNKNKKKSGDSKPADNQGSGGSSTEQPKKKSWFSKKEKSNSSSAPAAATPATAASGKPAAPSASSPAQAGQVWVNLDSGIYHTGGRWYGKTKNGKFMSEAEAIKAGYKEDKTEAKRKK